MTDNNGSNVNFGGLQGLSSLLQTSATGDSPLLSQQSSMILAGGANQLTALGAAGHDITRTKVNEALQLWLLIDRSGSMTSVAKDVVKGQNALLDDLAKDPRSKEMSISQWEFDDVLDVIHPALPLDQAKRLGRDHDFRPRGATALWKSWEQMLTAAVAHHTYNEEESPFPVPTTSVCIVLTDGGETEIRGQLRTKKAAELTKLADDLLRSERFHLAFLGFDRSIAHGMDPKQTHFWTEAKEMGFPDGCIGVDSDIIKAFARISSSVRQVSTGRIQPGVSSTFFTP